MKIVTSHEQLSSCLDYVVSVIPPARIDPILSHVLVRAEQDQITMIGTNHEVQMTASCRGECDGKIERLIPADKLRRVLATFTSDTVIKLEFNKEEVKIRAERSTFKLMTQNTERFTLLGETSEMKALETLPCEDFLEILHKVQYATAEESHRRSLNGVLFQRTEEGLNFVGTDGHRMVVKTVAKTGGENDSYIIPVKTVHILSKHIGTEGEVAIAANDRAIRFNSGNFELVSNVIQETYPDYQHVIPRNNKLHAIVERALMKRSLDRVLALSDNKAIAYLEFDDNKLVVSANNTDNDSLSDHLDINYSSEKIVVALNAVYVTQFLNVCKEQMMEIFLSAPENSVLMRPVEEVESVNYVVMPVRT